MLVRNARVLDDGLPVASCLGVLHGRVVGLDDVADLPALRTVDVQGATVVPGFHDAHVHTTSFGIGLRTLDLTGAVGLSAVLAAVARHAAGLAPDAWVTGSGYGLGLVRGEHPSRQALDAAGGGRPVWLTHFSGHVCVLSSAALAQVGVTAGAAAGRGRVGLGPDGAPDGVLEESAMDLVKDHLGPASQQDLAAAIDVATRVYAAEGVTTFVDAGIGSPGIDHSPVELGAYQLARETGRLHVRGQLMVHDAVLHQVRAHADDAVEQGLDLGLRTGVGDGWLEVGAMKIWVDGAAGNDFDDSPEALRRSIVSGARGGWQVAAHAMGDRAVDLVLDALDEAGTRPDGRPHRIEHGASIRPDQVARLADMGVAVAHQPSFLPTFGDRLSATGDAYRLRSLLDAGVVVAGSSDRPVAPGPPLTGMQAMVERLTESGASFGPDERVDARTALRAYTAGGASAAGRAHRSGALRPGFDADVVVLAEDPVSVPTGRIGSVEVLATLVAGRPAYDPGGLFGGDT